MPGQPVPAQPDRPTVDALAAATPADRDRYVDLLRAAALLVVVLGHWLMVVLWRDGGAGGTGGAGDGALRASTLLALAPSSRWLTWALQVMPLFFVVGGYANAASRCSATARGDAPALWVRRRAVRLLRPALPLLAAWSVALPVLDAAGLDPVLVRAAALAAVTPLWFLATYLAVIAAAPAVAAAHRRPG